MERKRKIDCPAMVTKVFVHQEVFPSYWDEVNFFIHTHELIGKGLDKRISYSKYINGKLDSEIFEAFVDEIQLKPCKVNFEGLLKV